MDEEIKDNTLKDEVKKLNDNFASLLESGKIKGVKIPRKGKLSKSKKKKNFITLIKLGENKIIKVDRVQVDESTINVDGVPRIASVDYMFDWEGNPTVILPEWSVEPFSPVQNYEDTVREKMTAAGWRLMINKLEQGEIKGKKKMSGAIIFAIVIGIIVIGYLLLKK